MNQLFTIRTALDHAVQKLLTLYAKEEAENIASWIVEKATRLNRSEVRQNRDKQINPAEEQYILNALDKLLEGMPVQYVVGEVYFMDMKLMVNPSVLIPRPETEELCMLILKENNPVGIHKVLDICTGSGCIALALEKGFKNAEVTALDISEAALLVATENAKKNNASIQFLKHDIIKEDPFSTRLFDLIVSNPPYVMEIEKKMMRRNVLDHEPHEALFVSDSDPLLFYRRIAFKSLTWLNKGGQLYFEINENKGQEIVEMLKELNYANIKLRKDIYDKWRFVSAQYI